MISMARTFGAPVIEPPGKVGPQQIHGVRGRVQLAHHRGDQVVDGGVVLQREQLRHPDGAGAAHPGEVVPQQIHDHHVLGPVLVALLQGAAERRVVHRAEAARAGALDRPGLDVPAVLVEPEEALRGGAHHLEPLEAEIGGEGRRIPAPEPAIQLERRLPERGLKALRQVRLKDVARDDVLPHPGHGVQIAAVGEGGAKLDRARPRRSRSTG